MDTTAKEGYDVNLGKPLGTQKSWGTVLVGKACEYHSRRGGVWCCFGEAYVYHSRLEEDDASLGSPVSTANR